MSFQQLDEPWVKAEDMPPLNPAPFLPPIIGTFGPWQSTPIERRWFTASRSVGRLEDTSIDDMLVSLELQRPGCMSPCSESMQGSFRLSEETTREVINEAWRRI